MKKNQLRIGKYVIVKDQPILFPVELVHRDIVHHAQSAGFFILQVMAHGIEVYCWGESVSLGLKSNEAADARMIHSFVSNIAVPAQPVPVQTP